MVRREMRVNMTNDFHVGGVLIDLTVDQRQKQNDWNDRTE
jgi:hypothetical protein